jgi:hypothetical protein
MMLCHVEFEENSEIKEIGKEVFCGCCSLEMIKIPASVEKIGEMCFANCCLCSEVGFHLSSKLKEIGASAFSGCALETIRIRRSVERIGDGCFSGCTQLSEVEFQGAPVIGKYCFEGCVLKHVVFSTEAGSVLHYEFPADCQIEYL